MHRANQSIYREAFFSDTKTQDAVLRNLQTLGESTQRLSDSLKTAYPDLNWRGIAAFRNVLVHNYLGIDMARIWDIVEHDLAELQGAIKDMLKDQDKPSS